MQDKQEILKSFLTLLDKTLSKEEYLAFSKTLMDFVVKIEKNNSKEFDAQWQKIKDAVSEMEGKEESDFETLKADLSKTVKDQVSDMYANWAKMSDQVQTRIAELKDGEDADESKVCDMVMEKMAQMPKPEIPKATPEETRDKLETLTGDERLDKSAIKGIDEELEKLKEIRTIVRGVTGANYWQKSKGVTSPKFDTDAVVVNAHEATGLIPQVSNSTYGTADSIDMTSMPVGTFYFKHEA
jgi:hypothetical protein